MANKNFYFDTFSTVASLRSRTKHKKKKKW